MRAPRFLRAIGSSLVLRIFLIVLALLILPLTYEAIREVRERVRDRLQVLFLTLDLIGRGKATEIEVELQRDAVFLGVVAEFFPYNDLQLSAHLEPLAKKEGASLIALLDAQGKCLAASEKELVGKAIFQDEFLKHAKDDKYSFLGKDPLTGKGEVVTARHLRNGLHFMMGRDAEALLQRWSYRERNFYPVALSLINPDGSLFASTESGLDISDIQLISSSDLEERKKSYYSFVEAQEESAFFHLFGKLPELTGLKLPIAEADFSILMTMHESALITSFRKALFERATYLLLLTIVLGSLAAILATWRMGRAMKQLKRVMTEVGDGHLEKRYVDDRWGFETNQLGSTFNQVVCRLISNMEEAQRQRVGKELFEQELAIASSIQRRLFPGEAPELMGLKIQQHYKPALMVAGDFYDLFPQEKRLLILMADAASKGISACLFALLLRAYLRASFAEEPLPLQEIIENVNKILVLDTEASSDFVTAWVGIYEPETRRLTYASCGHPPAVLKRVNEKPIELTTSGIPFGIEGMKPEIKEMTLQTGDLLLAYTDGVIEAQSRRKEQFGRERLLQLFSQGKDASSAMKNILHELDRHCESEPLIDDQTLLILEVKK